MREELNQQLTDHEFEDYTSLSTWLGKQGYCIARKEVAKYHDRLEQRLDAVRMATEQARGVVSASQDDDNRMSEALLRLVQHHLFSVLVDLNPQDPQHADLRAIARTVAELGRSAIMHKKFAEEMRERVARRVSAAEPKVMSAASRAAAANGGGLSAEAEAEIKRALLEIAER